MDVLIHGYTGRMGTVVSNMAREGVAGANLVARVSPDCTCDGVDNCYVSLDHFTGHADCVVDFSNHSATETLVNYCCEKNFALVIATTGQTEEELAMIHAAAKKIPIFFSANMSIGVALVADLAKKAAATFPDADIEIIEKHHNQKLDVPSGTALLLANKIREARTEAVYNIGRHEYGKRTKDEIGIHSLRLGGEVGTHEIIIATGSETITIKHEAENRMLFADGAMTAAAFISGKPAGLYTMQDIIA